MQLYLGTVPIILRSFSKARGHLLFSNYFQNNLPKLILLPSLPSSLPSLLSLPFLLLTLSLPSDIVAVRVETPLSSALLLFFSDFGSSPSQTELVFFRGLPPLLACDPTQTKAPPPNHTSYIIIMYAHTHIQHTVNITIQVEITLILAIISIQYYAKN